MNCQRFESLVSELVRGRMMAAEQRGEALAHSDACEDCGARLRDDEMLTRGLQFLAIEMESLEAPAAIETKLLAEFRDRSAAPAATARRPVDARYWLSAVAAILLIAIAIVAIRSRTVNESKENARQIEAPKPVEVQEPPREKQQPANESSFAVNDPTPQRNIIPQKRRSNRVKRTAPAVMANHVTNEIATDFMPLGYMNAASLQDGGQIIRVELRRSALANFGVPVNMDRYNEKVKADVLLGVDGMARAIRFVQ
jgi:hypothetical protein